MQERLKFAIESSGIGMWEWQIATGELYWTENVFKIFNKDKNSFKPTFENYISLIHKDDLEYQLEQINKFVAGEIEKFEVVHRILINGSVRWIDCKGQLISNDKGHAQYMLGTVTDITNLKSKEQALEIKIIELEKRERALKNQEQILFQNLDLQTKLLQNIASNEANLISLINNTGDSIWAVDRDYKILVINDNFKEIMKFFAGREVNIGENILDTVDPSFASIWKINYDKTFEGNSFTIEFPIGDTIVENSFNPIYNGEGKITGASIFSRDITTRKQNEIKVKENEIFLTALFKNLPIGMEVYSSDGFLLSFNDQLLDIYNLSNFSIDEGKININQFPLVHEYGLIQDFNKVRDTGQEILDHEVYIDFQKKDLGFSKSLASKWLSFSHIPVKDENNVVSKVVVLTQDITSRKLSEHKIALSEEKFYKAFELSPDLITMYGLEDLVIAEINSRSLDILGYSKEEMIGQPANKFKIFVYPEERDEYYRQFKEKGEISMQATICRKNGAHFIAQINGKEITLENKKYLLTVSRDITETILRENKISEAYNNEKKLNEELATREEELRSNQEELRQNIEYQNALIDQLKLNEYKLTEAMKMGKMGVWEVQPENEVVIFSKELSEIYETNNQTTFNFQESSKFFPDEEATITYNLLMDCIKNGTEFHYETIAHPGHNPKIIKYINVYGKRIQEEGKPVRIIGISQDITDRKIEEEKIRKSEIELVNLSKQISELKLMALRSVMNPHFIFNSLNSIQYFISSNDRKNAINYLSMFSKLIRGVLNSSVQTKISLEDELEILKYYIQLENVRFGDKFNVVFNIDPTIDVQNIEIPSLLIQPYVENALLHGLYNKNEKGNLIIAASLISDEKIQFIIEDDGVGRAEAQRIKNLSMPSHKSVGMMVTKERLKIINLTNEVVQEIDDLYDNQNNPIGTRVKLIVKFE
ncbi:MAG: PAS domain S-box protein [Bacteroidota bacterium]|nr:PAS domain S-box protein [Bacteroidota bacterium]